MIINRSRIETFANCPRAYYFRFVVNLDKPGRSPALRTGSAFHKFIEHWYINHDMPLAERTEIALTEMRKILTRDRPPLINESFAQAEQKLLAQNELLANQYIKEWGEKEDFVILGTEIEFTAPLGDTHQLKGQADGVANYRDNLWILENKTGAQYGASIIEKYMLNHQLISYAYGMAYSMKRAIAGILLNFARKPQDRAQFPQPEYHRETFTVEPHHIKNMLQSFHSRTEEIVNSDPTDIRYWPQDTNRCHDYGRCIFWEICQGGLEPVVKEGGLYALREPDYVDDPGARRPSPPTK